MQATFVGVEPSGDPRIDDALAGSEYASGVVARMWAYDSRLGGEPAGLTPAWTSLNSGAQLVMEPDPEGEGFRLDGADGLRYLPGEEVEVEVVVEEEPRWLRVVAPDAPVFAISEYHLAGVPISLSLSGQDFSRVVVLVIDVETSETVWDNLPDSVDDAGLDDRGPDALDVMIPGEVFEADRLFAVGVAGAAEAGPDQYSSVNTAISGFTATRFAFTTVCTFSDPDLCDPDLDALPPEAGG